MCEPQMGPFDSSILETGKLTKLETYLLYIGTLLYSDHPDRENCVAPTALFVRQRPEHSAVDLSHLNDLLRFFCTPYSDFLQTGNVFSVTQGARVRP